MNTVQTRSSNGQRGTGLPGDVGEIVSVAHQEPVTRISRAQLTPREEAASLRPANAATPGPIAPLTSFLGTLLTGANPVWGGNSISLMRELQKCLVGHSLTKPKEERSACMAAISVVEKDVQLRLRFQQMHMTEVEMAIETEGVKAE